MRLLAAVVAVVVVGAVIWRLRQQRALPEVTSKAEDGWHDLEFKIIGITSNAGGHRRIHAAGSHEGVRVEFQAELEGPWRSGQLGDTGISTHAGVVRLLSTGTASDEFVRCLDQIYGTHLASARMADSVEFAALSLEGDPSELLDGPVKLKLFFESDDDERYAELFLNIHASEQRVEFHEKDEAYRAPIIRALTR